MVDMLNVPELVNKATNSKHRKSASQSSINTTSTIILTPQSSASSSPSFNMASNGHGHDLETEDISDSTSTHEGIQSALRLKLQRKASTPMMPAFMVSAPGKVIVFGEHSVVHGKVQSALLHSLSYHY